MEIFNTNQVNFFFNAVLVRYIKLKWTEIREFVNEVITLLMFRVVINMILKFVSENLGYSHHILLLY